MNQESGTTSKRNKTVSKDVVCSNLIVKTDRDLCGKRQGSVKCRTHRARSGSAKILRNQMKQDANTEPCARDGLKSDPDENSRCDCGFHTVGGGVWSEIEFSSHSAPSVGEPLNLCMPFSFWSPLSPTVCTSTCVRACLCVDGSVRCTQHQSTALAADIWLETRGRAAHTQTRAALGLTRQRARRRQARRGKNRNRREAEISSRQRIDYQATENEALCWETFVMMTAGADAGRGPVLEGGITGEGVSDALCVGQTQCTWSGSLDSHWSCYIRPPRSS